VCSSSSLPQHVEPCFSIMRHAAMFIFAMVAWLGPGPGLASKTYTYMAEVETASQPQQPQVQPQPQQPPQPPQPPQPAPQLPAAGPGDLVRIVHDDANVTAEYGPHADLAAAMSLVLINLTNVSGTLSEKHNISNPRDDLMMLYDKVDGFYVVLQEVMGEDFDVYCPFRAGGRLRQCIEIGMCLIQRDVPRYMSMATYTSLMEHKERFTSISWETIQEFLGDEDPNMLVPDEHSTPEKYRCDGNQQEDSRGNLSFIQVQSTRSQQALAAALLLEHATQATHRILDGHRINSSMEATIEALEHTWQPFCEKVGCDHTNHWDHYLASHGHTMELIEVGAHASHLRKQVRNRNLLEIRVQKFAAEHGETFADRYYRTGESQKSLQRATTYLETLRYKHTKFMLQYVHSLDDEEKAKKVLRLVDRQAFAKFFARHQENPQELQLPPHMEELVRNLDTRTHAYTQAPVQSAQEEGELEEAHTQALVQSAQEEGELEGRFWRRRRRRRRRGTCNRRRFFEGVGCAISRVVNAVVGFIATVFRCFGQPRVMTVAGFAKKFPFAPPPGVLVGVGISFGCNAGIDIRALLNGQPADSIACGIGVVFGAVPFTPVTGGFRAGVGVGGGISCSGRGCRVGIAVGAVASALIPTNTCSLGGWFAGFRCMRGVGLAITAVCCQFDLTGGSHDCR